MCKGYSIPHNGSSAFNASCRLVLHSHSTFRLGSASLSALPPETGHGIAQTGMGRSATTQISLPEGLVRNGMATVRNIDGQTILSASGEKFPLAYAIGSGNEGVSLLVNVNSFLFQALSPGIRDGSSGIFHLASSTTRRLLSIAVSARIACFAIREKLHQFLEHSIAIGNLPLLQLRLAAVDVMDRARVTSRCRNEGIL